MKVCIFDLDGTLCSIDPEYLVYIAVTPKNWRAFEAHIPHDLPVPQVVDLASMMFARGYKIIVLTARPELCRKASAAWLVAQSIVYDQMYMRKDGDFRPDYVVKEEFLAVIRREHGEIYWAIDDRKQVCEMYARNGVFVLDVGNQRIES
jgi:FMN phosphatase YigB (HAD superfamily)